VRQSRGREVFVQEVVGVVNDFVEELLVSRLAQLFVRRQVGWTEARSSAATQESVDSLAVGQICETPLCTSYVQQLGNDDRSKMQICK
jgi:hypothetical protein